MRLPKVYSAKELHDLIMDVGFLPFFRNEISGFSVEECTPYELWFSDDTDGPWEWKGELAESGDCAYGKLFWKKAGFVSMEWYPVLANYRRNGYDFDALYEDGMASQKDKYIYDTILSHKSLLSTELKELCNYKKGGNKGFDTIITRLQMQTYVTIDTFEYKKDKHGNSYGWGIARYTIPENKYGEDEIHKCYLQNPADSRRKMEGYLSKLLPDATEKQIIQIIG